MLLNIFCLLIKIKVFEYFLGKPQKNYFFIVPTTKALIPLSLELSGNIFFRFFYELQKISFLLVYSDLYPPPPLSGHTPKKDFLWLPSGVAAYIFGHA